PGSLSYTPRLETDTASQPPGPRPTLAAATVAGGLAVHDLVRRRLLARTLRVGPRLLRRLASTTPPTWPDLCRLRQGAGQIADACAARPGPGGAWPPGPSLRRVRARPRCPVLAKFC